MKKRNFFWLNFIILFFSFSLISCSSGNNEANSEESLSLQSAECAKPIKKKSKPTKQRINYTEKASAMKFIDEKRIYLIDLTRSMEGFNGSEDIFDTVKRQLKNAIMSLTDTTTQVVLIPFTDRPLDFVDKTIANKVELLDYIENLETKRGDTNILSAWQKGVEQLDPNKVNYLFMLTDGVHNTGEPIENLYNELGTWHDITQGKYQFAFYVLLSQHAREEEICDIVENSKQMWLVPSLNIDTDFILGKLNLSVNIINTNKVKLHLTCTNPEIFNDGFNIKLSIPENEYYKIVNASRVLDADGFITFEIEKLKPQNELPVSYSTVLKVNYDKNKFPLVFFTPEEYNLTIDNIGTRTMNLTSKSK